MTRSRSTKAVLAWIGILACAGSEAMPGFAPVRPVLWAWERPEDLRFVGQEADIAILAGTVRLHGDKVAATPRLQPVLVLPTQRLIGVVHVEIDRRESIAWQDGQRGAAVRAVLALAANPRFAEVQVDFEARQSERPVLLGLLKGVRAGLPAAKRLSMTALASWCDTEQWLPGAPVDEVVPMLFRMGARGEAIRRRLADGGDFRNAVCRRSLGVAADTLPDGLPFSRRVYIFNPAPWTEAAFISIRRHLL